MFHSIRWRIAIPYSLLICLLMIVVAGYVTYSIRQFYLNDLESNLLTQAELINYTDGSRFIEDTKAINLDLEAKNWSQLTGSRVTLIAADGLVLGESHDNRERMDNHANRPEIQLAKSNGEGVDIRFSHTLGEDMMYVAIPVNQEPILGYIRLALPLAEINQTITRLQSGFIIFTVFATLIVILLATWIAGRTTSPLQELTEAAGRISSGDLDSRIELSTVDEVSQLTKAFNSMADKLRLQIDALESERGKLAVVLSEMNDGVLIIDDKGVIQLINRAAEQMFGVTHDEAIGCTLIEALRQYQLVDLWQKSQKYAEPQAILIEIHARRLYLQTVATNLGKALPGSTLMLFQNLTRLRHLETVRQDFISNISHELRTPLAALKALTETLQESALEDPPAARRFLIRMDSEVDALSMMVSELLELSRIESGKVPLKMKPVTPSDLINQAVDRLVLQAERAELTIDIQIEPGLKNVLADQSRLEQVLVNLLHNAIKFTPTGGSITVGCVADSDKARFWVQDTGIGIPKEDLDRIFERFYKTDRARSGGGTGLGLAIARHLVEAHGGKIWAKSVEGAGSTFYFTIPFITQI